jgi:hypothetical protein
MISARAGQIGGKRTAKRGREYFSKIWSITCGLDFERETVDGLAFQILVGVQVLSGRVDVGVAEELLHRDDVASALQEPCRVGVARGQGY